MNTFNISNFDKELVKFSEDGFLLIKNVIPIISIRDFETSFFKLFSSLLGEY